MTARAPVDLAPSLLGVPPAARAVIYAPGGGRGHRQRARVLAARLASRLGSGGAPRAALIVHTTPLLGPDRPCERGLAAASPDAIRGCLLELAHADAALVVDTFPGGLAGEVDAAVLAAYGHTALVRRYVRPERYPDYDRLAARFHAAVCPYPAARCEWDHRPAPRGPARPPSPGPPVPHTGPLVRRLHLAAGAAPAPLVVLGPARELPPGWRALLPSGAVRVDADLAHGALPPGWAYLSVGAGYNTAWELEALGRPYALVPLGRRYDDQFRRAALLGRAVTTRAQLAAFLAGALGARAGRRAAAPGQDGLHGGEGAFV